MFHFLSLTLVLFSHLALQAQHRSCDRAAPPAGMHYVCVGGDSCDCHLENDEPEGDQIAASPRQPPKVEPCSSHLKYFVAPAYPAAARRARKQGTVRAQLALDASGAATVKIESGDPAFAEQVVSALKRWRFAPADPPLTLSASFTFTLAGDPTENGATSVSGSSPLDLVITASPSLR